MGAVNERRARVLCVSESINIIGRRYFYREEKEYFVYTMPY